MIIFKFIYRGQIIMIMNFELFFIFIIVLFIAMGKKGVLLDNGKNAQSSMALYWRKHH
jgi:hypothetical protein